eukprot:12631414-Alexandrium_andersonii.AAC.1
MIVVYRGGRMVGRQFARRGRRAWAGRWKIMQETIRGGHAEPALQPREPPPEVNQGLMWQAAKDSR